MPPRPDQGDEALMIARRPGPGSLSSRRALSRVPTESVPVPNAAPRPLPLIHRVARIALQCDDWRWPFADARRTEIDAHFSMLRRSKPKLWNGRVLLCREPRFSATSFDARCFETDFASFLAWRDWGHPDATVFNVFGMGALCGADGGFVLGEMASHTANAGRVYFPSGTPDLDDIRDGAVDIDNNIRREVAEETGLTPDDYICGATACVLFGAEIAVIQRLEAPCSADELMRRIDVNLSAQRVPEFRAMRVVRGRRDFTPDMPDYVIAFIAAETGDGD